MRTNLSKHFGDAIGRILSKVEFEEDVHPRDPRGRFAPKEGGVGAEWMSGRDERDVQRQARLETDRKTAIEKVGSLIGNSVVIKVESWDQLSRNRKEEVLNRYIKDQGEREQKRRIDSDVRNNAGPIGRKVLADIGFPQDKIGMVSDSDMRSAYNSYGIDKRRNLSELIRLRTGMKKTEADQYSEAFFGKIEFAIEDETKQKMESEEGKKILLSAEDEAQRGWETMDEGGWLRAARNYDLDEDKIILQEPKAYKLTEDGQDYTDTGSLGNALSAERFKEIIKERNLQPDPKFINNVWDQWKESSTSELGIVLQHAAARELGANSRLESRHLEGIDNETIDLARAYVRAQWETSQFLMHKAGVDEIPVYRAVFLPGEDTETGKKSPEPEEGEDEGGGGPQLVERLPDLRIQQNGVSSWTSQREVANGWNGVWDEIPEGYVRVVLRARIPATAVFSLPVHGKNVASEQEVVVAGTPWKAWDAWRHDAPELENVPIEKAAPGLLAQGKAKAKGFVIDLNDPKITAGKKHWLTQKKASNPKPKKG